MTINLIGAARDSDPSALTVEVEQALLSLLASRELSETRTEEAAIDAEAFWTQAEEACDVDPIG